MRDGSCCLIVGGLGYVGSHVATHIMEKYPHSKLTIVDTRRDSFEGFRFLSKFDFGEGERPLIVRPASSGELVGKMLAERQVSFHLALFTLYDLLKNATLWMSLLAVLCTALRAAPLVLAARRSTVAV